MITLTRKLKKDAATAGGPTTENPKRISVRDRLLVKEVQDMEQNLPPTCSTHFPDANVLCEFTLTITPDEGFWKDGKFKFNISVPEEYNMTVNCSLLTYNNVCKEPFILITHCSFPLQPPKVKCSTRLWHPNISVMGEICLSLLRQNSIDGLGWAPTRTLKDVIWGLNSLFTVSQTLRSIYMLLSYILCSIFQCRTYSILMIH